MTDLRRQPGRHHETGVTLIELMVVLVVIAIGIMALSGVQTRSSTDVYTSGRHTRALGVAQSQIELARGMGYAAARPDSGRTDGFDWNARVDSVQAGLRQIQVTVSWAEAGVPRSLQLTSLVAAR